MKKKVASHANLFLSFLFCAAFLLGCSKQIESQKVKDKIPVKVSPVELRDLDETIDYVGNIKAQEEAVVYPKVSGKIIEKIKEDGAKVSKGEVIAYIDRDEVGFKFEKAPVESPLPGIIGRVYVDIGENVTIQSPIALVIDMDKMEIDLDIPEKYCGVVSLGQTANVSVDAYPQERFTGKVTKISPVCDLPTRSAPIEITLGNPGHKLRSGMFARVSLIIMQKKSIPVIIKEAVLGKEPNQYVYIIEDNKAVLRNIKLGIHQGPYYEVVEGIKEGDLVVILGQQRLYEGAEVTVEKESRN